MTYHVGEAEARDIAAEIGHDRCRIIRYDAREEAAPQLAGLEWGVDHLYYFATAHIARQKAPRYDPARSQRIPARST